jgi:putative PIN family toxin of toxin-antitoxin system
LKFEASPEDAATVLDRVAGIAEVVHPAETLHVIREDPDDDRVLECAVSGKADYIVTGDRHLLRLAEYRGIRIVRVREFLDSIEREPDE